MVRNSCLPYLGSRSIIQISENMFSFTDKWTVSQYGSQPCAINDWRGPVEEYNHANFPDLEAISEMLRVGADDGGGSSIHRFAFDLATLGSQDSRQVDAVSGDCE